MRCIVGTRRSGIKEIIYRGGLLRFWIPDAWVEHYESDGGGTFYEDAPDTGTLRLSVITARAPADRIDGQPADCLRGFRNVAAGDVQELANGNAFATAVTHSTEDGDPITMFWLYAGNFVRPDHIRIACFSYTVLTSREDDPGVVDEVRMLTESVSNIEFHPELGDC